MIAPIPDPILVLRLIKGAALTFGEGDANLTNLANFVEALQTLLLGIIGESLNEDGTLTPNSVGIQALQVASVSYAALNPGTLYSILPINTDTGTVQNAYQITTLGGSGSINNLVPGGAQYNSNGQYTLTGLTPNAAYTWTPKSGGNDLGLTQGTTGLTGSSPAPFISYGTSAILTGTPNDPVTALIQQSAYVTSYQNSQIFFVSTTRANTGPSTLQINNLSAVPIQYYGAALQANQIGAPGVFAVIYMNGVFWAFGGVNSPAAAQGGGTTVISTVGYNGITSYSAPAVVLASSAFPNAILQTAHGLGGAPTQFSAVLKCVNTDSGFLPGQEVGLGNFTLTAGGAAFTASFDSIYFYVTQYGASINVVDPATGASVTITNANWQLIVSGSVTSDYSGTAVFPALNYEFANVHGAFSSGASLFYTSQSNYSNSGLYYINEVNMLNNEITPLCAISTNIGSPNGAIFSGAFFGLTTAQFLFSCSGGGIWRLPAVNPGVNAISPDTSYNGSGSATITGLTSSTAYTWTPAANDVSLTNGITTILATSAVNGQVKFNTSGTTVTLTGSPNTVISGTIITSAATWQPVQVISPSNYNNFSYKPVWVDVSFNVYLCVSDTGTNNVSNIGCFKATSSGSTLNSWAANNSAPINLTSNSVVGASGFQQWHPLNSGAPVMLFQYNPISQRIYVMTQETSLVHIFQLAKGQAYGNDFSQWFNTASRETFLTYVKALSLSGMGRNVGTWSRCHVTVEFDQVSGNEKAIVFTRDGNNSNLSSVTRVPWAE